MDNRQHVDEVASQWIVRRDAGGWSETEQAELTQWLQASTAHMVAYLRMEAMWQQANRLRALGAGVPVGAVPSPGEIQNSPYFDKTFSDAETSQSRTLDQRAPDRKRMFLSSSRRLYWSAAAALLLAATGLSWWQGLLTQTKYSTPIGGMSSVPLSDGSKVLLNTGSDIQLKISETERRIHLEHGEAFFEVARDPKRPFVVIAGDKRIVAVGTQFSVRRNAEDVQVVVTEGKVRVEQADPKQAESIAQLTAGSIARAGSAGVRVERRSMPELEEYLSWRTGYVVFRETPLIDAATEFNRYNSRKIVIEDPAVAAIRIGGKFRSTNIESFIHLLQDGFSVRAEEREDRIILTAR